MEKNNFYLQKIYNPRLKVTGYKQLDKLVSKHFGKESVDVRKNIRLYILNFLFEDRLAICRTSNWFSDNKKSLPDWHTYRKAVSSTKKDAKSALDNLIDKGYIIKVGGGTSPEEYFSGFLTCYAVTDTFKKVFGKLNINKFEEEVNLYADLVVRETEKSKEMINGKMRKKKEVIFEKSYRLNTITKDDKKGLKELEKSIPYLKFILESVHDLNKNYFNKITLDFQNVKKKIIKNVYLTSIITNKKGGRLYQQHGLSYQNMSKEERKHLTINGEPIVEVDIGSSHINIIYAKNHIHNPYTDSYEPILNRLYDKFNLRIDRGRLKEIVKSFVLICLNNLDFRPASTAMHSQERKETENKRKRAILNGVPYIHEPNKINTLKEINLTLKDIYNAFCEVHPIVIETIKKSKTPIANDCMSVEAIVLINALLRLKNRHIGTSMDYTNENDPKTFKEVDEFADHDILALPLHDALLTTEKNKEMVSYVLGEEFFNYNNGYGAIIKTKKPE